VAELNPVLFMAAGVALIADPIDMVDITEELAVPRAGGAAAPDPELSLRLTLVEEWAEAAWLANRIDIDPDWMFCCCDCKAEELCEGLAVLWLRD
jgi:hypothetical protein